MRIKENLAEGQITDPSVIRKPSGEKTWGIVPKYNDFFEGYISGGIAEAEGKPLQGVVVKVTDDKGSDLSQFTPGVTDSDGIYRIRFSLPIRWHGVDFSANLAANTPWRILAPQTRFRIYFNRGNGVLAYLTKEVWLAAGAGIKFNPPLRRDLQKKSGNSPDSNKKKSDDVFGDFNFGPQ